ncbi:MAG: hypothetical protein IJ457_00290 [Clostridia bacterium]|nr:hypothetical protein [Clostridia bacterium]
MHTKFKYFLAAIMMFICFMPGCESATTSTLGTTQSSKDLAMNYYYTKEDFNSLKIGESTFEDLCNLAEPETIWVLAFGLRCRYPMQNGGYVEIDCYGGDKIVGAIRETN